MAYNNWLDPDFLEKVRKSTLRMRNATNVRYRARANMSGFNGVSNPNATPNAAEVVSKSSKVGTWLRNRPRWQKAAAGGTVGIVGARAIFGRKKDNGPSYYGY